MINLKTENNKDIFIYDNVFESHNVQKYYYYIINSFFKLNGKDGDVLEQNVFDAAAHFGAEREAVAVDAGEVLETHSKFF